MSSAHAWELPQHDWDSEPECPHDDEGWGGEYSGSDVEADQPSVASEFIHFMISLVLARTLNARQFCICMHWAAKAGLATTKPYGYAPGRPSGHYARHLKPLLGSPDQIARL